MDYHLCEWDTDDVRYKHKITLIEYENLFINTYN